MTFPSSRLRKTRKAALLKKLSLEQLEHRQVLSVTPVAAYGFNDGSGDTLLDDSGNGHAGAITGPGWSADGRFGGALQFDGVNDLVTIADADDLDLTTGMTLEAWINPSSVTRKWRDVIYKGNDIYFLEATSTNSSRPAGAAMVGGTDLLAFGTSALSANAWSHLTVTYDGAVLRLYVNGVEVSSAARTGSIQASASPLQIGGDSSFGQFFAGLIDEVRIYDQALTPAEIQADMNTPVGSASPDTEPPSAPENLNASAVSSSQIDLSSTAATDNSAASASLRQRPVPGV